MKTCTFAVQEGTRIIFMKATGGSVNHHPPLIVPLAAISWDRFIIGTDYSQTPI